MTTQLTIGGGEVPSGEAVRTTRMPPLNSVQRLILNKIEAEGFIRSVEAGVIVHTARGHCGFGAKTRYGHREGSLGCCPYASADGLSMMHRLEQRGLVRRERAGRWFPA